MSEQTKQQRDGGFPNNDYDRLQLDVWLPRQTADCIRQIVARTPRQVAQQFQKDGPEPFYRNPRPEDIAEELSRRLGRWGGGTNLEEWYMDGRSYGFGQRHTRPIGRAKQ